ncbi:MAG: MerR family transcriptional regulator, partial [Pseudonocardia sediminis]
APAAAEVHMSDADRSLVVVMTRVLGPEGMKTYADLLQDTPTDPVTEEFDTLAADADEATRQSLAERMAPYTRDLQARHPGLLTVNDDAPGGEHFARQTVGKAMRDLYNDAQIDVMVRMQSLLAEPPPTDPA